MIGSSAAAAAGARPWALLAASFVSVLAPEQAGTEEVY
jgi:hypothetical protein